MHGIHSARTEPEPGKLYSFLIDVAGQDECAGRHQADTACASTAGTGAPADGMSHRQAYDMFDNPGCDSTALKIVEIDMSTVPTLGKPTYKVVHRQSWTGQKHVTVFGALRALATTWHPRFIVIDATGVGEGLWSLLDNSFGSDLVLPVKFTPAVKSELSYGFLSIVESGRYQECSPFDDTFRLQLDKTISEIVPGPAKLMRWSVPDGTRDPSGEPVHDDDLITSALCVILDQLKWTLSLPAYNAPAPDPLKDMDRNF
jgi:hypothetical protein